MGRLFLELGETAVTPRFLRGKKPPWIPSHCSIAVKGWSSVDGFCLKSDTFELWGDWQTETWLATFPVETKKKAC